MISKTALPIYVLIDKLPARQDLVVLYDTVLLPGALPSRKNS